MELLCIAIVLAVTWPCKWDQTRHLYNRNWGCYCLYSTLIRKWEKIEITSDMKTCVHLNQMQLGPHRLLNCFSLRSWMRAPDALLGDRHRDLRAYMTPSWFHELGPEIPTWLSMTSFVEGPDHVFMRPFDHHVFIWVWIVASTRRPSSLTLRICFKPVVMGRENISTWTLYCLTLKG